MTSADSTDAGIAVGVVIGVMLLCALLYCCCRRSAAADEAAASKGGSSGASAPPAPSASSSSHADAFVEDRGAGLGDRSGRLRSAAPSGADEEEGYERYETAYINLHRPKYGANGAGQLSPDAARYHELRAEKVQAEADAADAATRGDLDAQTAHIQRAKELEAEMARIKANFERNEAGAAGAAGAGAGVGAGAVVAATAAAPAASGDFSGHNPAFGATLKPGAARFHELRAQKADIDAKLDDATRRGDHDVAASYRKRSAEVNAEMLKLKADSIAAEQGANSPEAKTAALEAKGAAAYAAGLPNGSLPPVTVNARGATLKPDAARFHDLRAQKSRLDVDADAAAARGDHALAADLRARSAHINADMLKLKADSVEAEQGLTSPDARAARAAANSAVATLPPFPSARVSAGTDGLDSGVDADSSVPSVSGITGRVSAAADDVSASAGDHASAGGDRVSAAVDGVSASVGDHASAGGDRVSAAVDGVSVSVGDHASAGGDRVSAAVDGVSVSVGDHASAGGDRVSAAADGVSARLDADSSAASASVDSAARRVAAGGDSLDASFGIDSSAPSVSASGSAPSVSVSGSGSGSAGDRAGVAAAAATAGGAAVAGAVAAGASGKGGKKGKKGKGGKGGKGGKTTTVTVGGGAGAGGDSSSKNSSSKATSSSPSSSSSSSSSSTTTTTTTSVSRTTLSLGGAGLAATAESAAKEEAPAAILQQVSSSSDTSAAGVVVAGRLVPMSLIESTEMIAVSHPQLMRLLIKNQNQISRLFRHYGDDDSMSLEVLQNLGREMDIVPEICSRHQLAEVFTIVNASEASDGAGDSLDAEEFSETLVRVGVYYTPGDYDLSKSEDVVSAVEKLLLHMNDSMGASALVPPVKFTAAKRRGKRR